MSPGVSTGMDRRAYLASLAALSGATSLAGCSFFERESDADTRDLPEERARELAEAFAPTLYFDEHERWFPTDPRAYTTEQDGETVVDGFDALNGYTEARGSGEPPAPTLFYHAMEYIDSPLSVVQYWYYSAFDQFTTNFHWHDWEVFHAFIDTDTDDPGLYVASSHSGRVPNNEFLDPDPERSPRILSELGSHSSALSLNNVLDRFQRLPFDGTLADITNSAIGGIEDVIDLPIAYGLPRDEGSRLPYLIPELDGEPIYEHPRLPSVERADLVPDELTVRSFTDLASPPGDLPRRATGLVFGHASQDTEVDVGYDLLPSGEVEEISAFTGPQLSFEFTVPEFAEDAIAGHITTTGVPWKQPRYTDPAADISDPSHRATLAERYDVIAKPPGINTLIADVTEAVASGDAPEGEGLTTRDLSVEAVALIESDPEAVPTFGGAVVLQGVPAGDHRLSVNGPGVAPHAETVAVADNEPGPAMAGVEGEVSLVARENATKLEVDTEGADADLTHLAVEDDFAGRLYDAPLSGPDAVYVHRGGAYTTEVRDDDDEIGAHRINPGTENRVRIDKPETGTGPLATYLADLAEETAAAIAAVDGRNKKGPNNSVENLSRALSAVADAAKRAADRAAAGEAGRADRSLETVQERLTRVATRLTEANRAIPESLRRAVARRLDQSRRRAEQARNASTL